MVPNTMRRLGQPLILAILVLCAVPVTVTGQVQEMLHRGALDEVGWHSGDLQRVLIVLTTTAEAGCQLERMDPEMASRYSREIQVLAAENPEFSVLLGAGFGILHPVAQSTIRWLERHAPCESSEIQQMVKNGMQYVLDYRSNRPTEDERLEAQREEERRAWWATLDGLKQNEATAQVRGLTQFHDVESYDILNIEDVLRAIDEALPSEPDRQCLTHTLRALFDESGQPVGVFHRYEASGYSDLFEEYPERWEQQLERCPEVGHVKAALGQVQLAPVRSRTGLVVPTWMPIRISRPDPRSAMDVSLILFMENRDWRLSRDGNVIVVR